MTIEYKEENPFDIKEELLPLHKMHYEDDPRKKSDPLDINWDLYNSMYLSGSMTLLTARDDGSIVGYITVFKVNHQHNKTVKMAEMDTLFVRDSHRSEGLATNLVKRMEVLLKEGGVSWFHLTFRTDEKGKELAITLGFSKTEVTYSKRLGEES